MISKSPIIPQRIRRITGSFSWLDHRLLHHGFIERMQTNDIALYFFLVLVGDKNGVSYYGYDRMCGLLKLSVDELIHARDRLIEMSLLAFDNGRYQVLALPEPVIEQPIERCQQIVSIKQLLGDAVSR